MGVSNLIIFVFLAAIWGASFLFMRVGVPEIGPYAFGGLRLGIAGICLLPFLLSARRRVEFKDNFKNIFIVGVIGYALPFTLFSYAATTLNAGVSSVLNASVPAMTGIIGYLLFKSNISKRQMLGIAIGIVGVFVLISDKFSGDFGGVTSILAALLACVCYGYNMHFVRNYVSHIGSLTLTSSSLFVAGIITLPMTIYFYPVDKEISTSALLSVVAIGVLSTALALYLINILIKNIGPIKSSMVTLLIPIFGILFGVIFLNENLTINIIIGTVIIISSAVLSLKTTKLK